MGTTIKHPVPYRVKSSFVIFDIRALRRSVLSVRVSGCQKFKWRLNPVWRRMLYSCAHMATVGVKGLKVRNVAKAIWTAPMMTLSHSLQCRAQQISTAANVMTKVMTWQQSRDESLATLTSCWPGAAGDALITPVGGGTAGQTGGWRTAVEDCRSCCPSLAPPRSPLPTAGGSAGRVTTRCSYTEGPACYRCSCYLPPPLRQLVDSAWTCWPPVSLPRALRPSDACTTCTYIIAYMVCKNHSSVHRQLLLTFQIVCCLTAKIPAVQPIIE